MLPQGDTFQLSRKYTQPDQNTLIMAGKMKYLFSLLEWQKKKKGAIFTLCGRDQLTVDNFSDE